MYIYILYRCIFWSNLCSNLTAGDSQVFHPLTGGAFPANLPFFQRVRGSINRPRRWRWPSWKKLPSNECNKNQQATWPWGSSVSNRSMLVGCRVTATWFHMGCSRRDASRRGEGSTAKRCFSQGVCWFEEDTNDEKQGWIKPEQNFKDSLRWKLGFCCL